MAWPETVRKSDLRIDFYRGSGAGGQHRNKTDSACRLTHLPTGITAQCEDERSQHLNRAKAFRRLAAKLGPMMKAAAQSPKEVEGLTERIRTYNEKGSRVTDHRVPGKTFNYDKILNGKGLQEVIEQVTKSKAY